MWGWAKEGNVERTEVQLKPLWCSRFFVTGPLSHYFYLFMEYWIPPGVPLATVKRLLLDRLLFAPTFLLLFFLIMNLLEVSVSSALAVLLLTGVLVALLPRVGLKVWSFTAFNFPFSFLCNYLKISYMNLMCFDQNHPSPHTTFPSQLHVSFF